jgi:FMN phosphatase YigB (HAD superfamily)
MLYTLLLDLDDTLLSTNMAAFLPAYYSALASHLASLVPPAEMMDALQAGLAAMLANTDPGRTLQEVFEERFYPRLHVQREILQSAIAEFYEAVFPGLDRNSTQVPGAEDLVNWARAAGHQIVLATDPLFPVAATEARVRWAGLEPGAFGLISAFEAFHFSKSHAAYYAELLGRLGWPDRPTLMAGNDVERDLVPARTLGLATYHTEAGGASSREAAGSRTSSDGQWLHGDLHQLLALLKSDAIGIHAPLVQTRAAILGILRATPAVLLGMTASLSGEAWRAERSEDEWAMIELVCHLRDTEREVHAEQLRSLIQMPTPFVARPDAAVWAKQRRYLGEDGPGAIREFLAARVAMLDQLGTLPDDFWNKKARHAIFGPSTFQEVIGFMADHDRLHLQQAWSILHPVGTPAHRLQS